MTVSKLGKFNSISFKVSNDSLGQTQRILNSISASLSLILFLVLYCFFFCRCSPLSTFLVAQWDFSHSAADAPDELLRGGATSAVLRVSRGHWDRGRDSSASSTYYSSLLPMKHVNFPWVLACISICISFQVTGVIVVFWHTFSSEEKQY